jgi:chromosomal replication initiation ATPase DnaA
LAFDAQIQQDWTGHSNNPLIAEHLSYDRFTEHCQLDRQLPQLNQDQRAAYDQIIASVNGNKGQSFFMSGPGGAGKTFVYNTICSKVRSEGEIILCVSSSGISSILIRGGRMAHSMFKIPIDDLNERSVCPIPKNSA